MANTLDNAAVKRITKDWRLLVTNGKYDEAYTIAMKAAFALHGSGAAMDPTLAARFRAEAQEGRHKGLSRGQNPYASAEDPATIINWSAWDVGWRNATCKAG